MKSRDGKSQRREEKKKEDQKRESLRRKKIQVREKVGKSRNTVFFQWCVAPEGRKASSLKRRVRSQLARWETKNCTLLWREAHFQVKLYKTLQLGALLVVDVEKCTPWWREAHCEVKSVKNGRLGALFEVSLSYRFPIFETSATALCGTTGMVGFLTLCLLLKSATCRPMSGDFVEDGVGLRALPWRSTGDVSRGGSGGQGLF